MDPDSDLGIFKFRASAFAHKFVQQFYTKLDSYRNTISLGRKGDDPPNKLVNLVGMLGGGALGVGAGIGLAPVLATGLGVTIATGTAASAAGGMAGKLSGAGVNYVFNKYSYAKKAKTVVKFVNCGTMPSSQLLDPTKQQQILLRILTEAAIEVSEMFEYQLRKIYVDEQDDLLRIMDKLAIDAVSRAMNYMNKCDTTPDEGFSSDFVVKALLQGESKRSTMAKIFRYGKGGHSAPSSDTASWGTAQLFGDIAVLVEQNVYLKSDTDKSMGYRNAASFESSNLEKWLQESGYQRADQVTSASMKACMRLAGYSPVATHQVLTEIGQWVIQQFEKLNSELRFDKIDDIQSRHTEFLEEIKTGVTQIAKPDPKISFQPVAGPHPEFTGRTDFIESAIRFLTSFPASASMEIPIQFPCLVIRAFGGYGKSQTARKIITECRKQNHFQQFLWIDSEDQESLQRCFFTAMREAALLPVDLEFGKGTNILTWLHQFYTLLLTNEHVKFLLVFDNIENLVEEQLLKYLPLNYSPVRNIAVLMTSRRKCQISAKYGGVEQVPLPLLPSDESMSLLDKILGPSTCMSTPLLDSLKEKQDLLERSGNVPLILHLMASTIKHMRTLTPSYKISDYLRNITNEPIEYSDRDGQFDLSYNKSFRQIVRIAIEKLATTTKSGPVVGELAVVIFSRAVYWSTNDVSIRDDFLDSHVQDIKNAVESCQAEFLQQMTALQKIQLAVRALEEFSLVELRGAGDISTFGIHRLVQAAWRLELRDTNQEKEILRALISELPNLGFHSMFPIWHRFILLWPHLLQYEDLVKRHFYPQPEVPFILSYYPLSGISLKLYQCYHAGLYLVTRISNFFEPSRSLKSAILEEASHVCKKWPPTTAAAGLGPRRGPTEELYIEESKTREVRMHIEIPKMILSAISHSSLSVVKHLVGSFYVDLNPEGSIYLEAAIRGGKFDIARWLLMDNHHSSLFTMFDLIIALCNLGMLEDVTRNLAVPIDFNEITEGSTGMNLISGLLYLGRSNLVGQCKILLEKGVNPSALDKCGRNSLHHAAILNNCDAIDLILESNSDLIESTCGQGWTPLVYAAAERNYEAVTRLLCVHHANVDGGATCTPLGAAVAEPTPILETFVKRDLMYNTERGKRKVHYPERTLFKYNVETSTKIVKVLVQAGCDVGAKDSDGNTALHVLGEYYYAYLGGNKHSALETLLGKRLDLMDIRNDEGLTPVELADAVVASEAGKKGVEKLRAKIEEWRI